MSDEIALSVRDAVLRFGGITAVDGVGFDVERGETFGIIGPNGAGKTALLNCVSGVYRLDGGTISLFGTRVDGLAPHRVSALGLARTFQNTEHFKRFTLLDYVLLGAVHRGRASALWSVLAWPVMERAERRERAAAREVLDLLGLAPLAMEELAELPYGVQKRADIARALAARPQVLLLDEPTSGTTTGERADVADAIDQVCAAGVTTVLVDHDVDFVSRRCGRTLVLAHGTPLGVGTPAEMLARPDVVEAFLGVPSA
ncbi:ABC transporter ATP-binding protein [Actinomadura vinacea]|uniref:ABC transporter ATP-binding protein n=1 Tax=Actinomadura vinacea TaxID=115336 RepID=A0ABP5VLL8_9ACTN